VGESERVGSSKVSRILSGVVRKRLVDRRRRCHDIAPVAQADATSRIVELTYSSDHKQTRSTFFRAFDAYTKVLERSGESGPQATPTSRSRFLLPRSFLVPACGRDDGPRAPRQPCMPPQDDPTHGHSPGKRRASLHAVFARRGWVRPPTHLCPQLGSSFQPGFTPGSIRFGSQGIPEGEKGGGVRRPWPELALVMARRGEHPCGRWKVQHHDVARSKVNCSVRQCPCELRRYDPIGTRSARDPFARSTTGARGRDGPCNRQGTYQE